MLKIHLLLCFQFFLFASPLLSNPKDDHNKIPLADTIQVKLLVEKANNTDKDSLKEALVYLNEAEKISLNLNFSSGLTHIYQTKGRFYYFNEFYEDAIKEYSKAISVIQETGDQPLLVEVLQNLGAIYFEMGNFKLATKHLLNSLEIAKENRMERAIAAIYNNLALIHTEIDDNETAIDYHNEALVIKKKLNLQNQLAISYHNIAEIYLEEGKYIEAEELFNKCIEICSLTNDITGISLAYMNLAIIEEKRENQAGAAGYFDKAFRTAVSSGNKGIISRVYVHQGSFFFNSLKYDSAELYLKKAYEISLEKGFSKRAMQSAKKLSEIYGQQKNYEKALNYFKEYHEMQDKYLNNLKKNNILGEKLAQQQKEKEKQLLLEIEERRKKRTKWRFYLIGGLIIASFIISIVVLRVHFKIKISKLERQRLSEDLDLKNRDLTQKMVNITQLNNQIKSVEKQLSQVKFDDGRDTATVELNKIAMELKHAQKETVLKEFESYFGQIHPSFYSNLFEKHPELTKNEKKLCAFLKLNMNTKEIATITNIKPSSIDTARSRLRKKLKLSSNIDLTDYINSIS